MKLDRIGYMHGLLRHAFESDEAYKRRLVAAMRADRSPTEARLRGIKGLRHLVVDRETRIITAKVSWWWWLWPWSVRRVKRELRDQVPAGVAVTVRACWR